MTIFDLILSNEIVAYWNELKQDAEPYPGQELFPDKKQIGLKIEWIKGAKGLPVVLKTSAFDTTSVPRPRIGIEKLSAEMPYFKESKYIDEELRQQLMTFMAANNTAIVNEITANIFDDSVELLKGAAASRERMRMMALTTGIVTMSGNGQTFTYDYGVTHKYTAQTSWSNAATADPLADIREAKEKIMQETGTKITRALCNYKTWTYLMNNEKIKKAIFVMTNGAGQLTEAQLSTYISSQIDVNVKYSDKRYIDEGGTTQKYIPDDTFVLFPDGALGNTCFGTTPEEADLMSSNVANVAITDTGVAVSTIKMADPVQVKTVVSQICLPSFPQADKVAIIDTQTD